MSVSNQVFGYGVTFGESEKRQRIDTHFCAPLTRACASGAIDASPPVAALSTVIACTPNSGAAPAPAEDRAERFCPCTVTRRELIALRPPAAAMTPSGTASLVASPLSSTSRCVCRWPPALLG